MKLLFDECVPRKVKFLFADGGHECEAVRDAGFSGKENGELLALAEGHFDVLVTIDRNIRYQQNMGRNIAALIIRPASNDLDHIELAANVYRFDPKTGETTVVATDMDKPNGLCFSPDEKKLYIADTEVPKDPSELHPIRIYDVVDSVRLKNGRLSVNMAPGSSYGIRCDVDGNVWSAAGWAGKGFHGVHVFAPDGTLIGKIHLPETCANLCFGGAKRNRLFMAASQSLYAIYVETQGAQARQFVVALLVGGGGINPPRRGDASGLPLVARRACSRNDYWNDATASDKSS